MKIRFQILILLLIAVGSFLAGSWLTFQGGRKSVTAERKILHYVDPMNPALKFDNPGIAPCGMPLEPVYADEAGAGAEGADLRASMPPGTIRIMPGKQQLIGVRVMTVERAPWTHTLRVLGRVTPDETLVYRINAATSGWIEKVQPVTTGSLVKENELLATLSFFSLEYRTLIQNYFNLFNLGEANLESLANNPQYSVPQLRQMRRTAQTVGPTDSTQVEYYRKYLYNYGIGPYQLAEIERTREFPEAVEIRAPAAGFIILRNVSPGLRLDRGAELFQIADLSRVWILADIFENEASYFRPGMQVRMELPYQKQNFYARVSPVLPIFDPATRTLKLRLEADNPGYVLRPDMFVNVELPVEGPPALLVPVDAVLDSGLKKTVFVDRGNGYFEPRRVETGRYLGDRVEIVRGLMPGEKIVFSGNFLIDSEARMQQAASGIIGKIGRDPVCGMNIDEDRAKAEGNFVEYKGKTYFFCEPQCREDFLKDPERYVKGPAPPVGMTMAPASPESAAKHAPHDAAAVPTKPRSVKAPQTHEGMPMPADRIPAAMPAAAPAGPMPREAAPPSEIHKEEIAPPAAATPTPRINLRTERYRLRRTAPQEGTQKAAPAPRRTKGFLPPTTIEPDQNQKMRQFPGPGDMPMPGSPDAAPVFGPSNGAPMPGFDAVPMFPPVVDHPGMGTGSPSSLGPADMPMPGPDAGPMSPPAADRPGMGPGSPSSPGPEDMPMPRPPATKPKSPDAGNSPGQGPAGPSAR